jgi:large subunit ribosomal protein L21
MFAIVRIGNKQYKVAPKDILTVDKIQGSVGETVQFDVLLMRGDKSVKVGKPIVKGAKVSAKILEQSKGEKIIVRRFKSKVRYRRARGFRPQLTKLEVTAVG